MVYTPPPPKIEMGGQSYSKVEGKTDNKIVKKCYVILSVLASVFGGNNPSPSRFEGLIYHSNQYLDSMLSIKHKVGSLVV